MENIKNYFLILISLLLIFFISKFTIDTKIDEMVSIKYETVALEMKDQAKIMIDEKKNATLTIATTLAENNILKYVLTNNDFSSVHFDKLSKILRQNSEFKNVWFQIISSEGISKYRSWIEKTGDSLVSKRRDITQLIKQPKTISTITTNNFDMIFRSMVPIYNQKRFLGFIEVITHFNSIYFNLLEKKIENILLVDKQYKDKFIYPFTKNFIEDYYVALLHTKQNFVDYIKSKGVEYVIHMDKEYIVSQEFNHLVTVLKIPDTSGDSMGYFILFKKLDNIDMGEIQNTKIVFLSILFSSISFLTLVIYYLLSRKYIKGIKQTNKELEISLDSVVKEKKKTTEILDSLPNLVVLSNGREMIDVNKSVMEFLDQYESFDELVKEHVCICDFFLDIKEENYIVSKEIEGINWLEHIFKNNTIQFKACMLKNGKKHHFIINAKKTDVVLGDEKLVVVSLTDITDEITLTKDIKEKDTMLFQQSRQASMGNMIGMIAHQWKQPLSAINMVINNVKADIDLDIFKKENLLKDLNDIENSLLYMNTTITDFKNFFKPTKDEAITTVEIICDESLRLLAHSLKMKEIQLNKNYKLNKEMKISDNELKQIVLNLINNAVDVLKVKEESERIINLNTFEIDNAFVIQISDNGGGIPEDIIDQLGTMYFTTKEEGTGLGLYMSMLILKQNLNGVLNWYNTKDGACFEIHLFKE